MRRNIIATAYCIFLILISYSANGAGESPFGPSGGSAAAPAQPQPPQTKTPDPAPSQPGGVDLSKAGQVAFNFDDADIYEVIRTIADVLNINYIVDPNVRGKVTVHTAGSLKKEDLFSVFFQVLEANGLTAVKDGNLYNIVSIKDASRLPASPHSGRFGDKLGTGERMMIQIIPLTYISSEEMGKLLAPFVSGGGAIVSHKSPNTLVVADKDTNIRKILKLVQAFDINLFEKANYRFYALERTDAEDMAKICTDIFENGDPVKDQAKFVAIARLNTLLAISSNPGIFANIEEVIRNTDIAGDKAEPKIYVYPVKNSEAGELSELLNSVFSETPSEKKDADKTGKDTAEKSKETKKDDPIKNLFPTAATSKKESSKKTSKKTSKTASGTTTLRGGMRITADETRNSLIIEATPKDYRMVAGILEKIDVLPRQVLIKVTVAEISLNTETQLGVEWSYVKGAGGTPSTSLLQSSIGSKGVTSFDAFSGLKFMIGEDTRWGATLSALATDGKVNILSTPTVLASDNKEANIEISDEVPVASAQYQYQSTAVEPLLQTNIQYRNTGVILTVTPHINEFGLVSMDIKQEVSELKDQSVKVGSSDFPAFYKRSVDTSLTVKNGQTIVIGGLIKDKKSDTMSGIPCLGSIPVIQYLFGTKTKKNDKTELIVLITPQVIASSDDVDAVSQEFKTKVGKIQKEAE